MDKSVKRFVKIYPWYAGFTGDLLFYIAIDTLFLTLVKNFTPAQMISITSFAQLVCIALQFPILFLMQKLGNTASVRTGAFCLLLSALFITFGKSYFLVLFGRILHDAAAIFRNASVVALENNLDLVDRKSDFVRLRTSANTVYAMVTMLISFVASYMFNLNNYLPMFGCITTCAVGFILSMCMKDSSDYNKISYTKQTKAKVKVRYDLVLIMIIVSYAIFYTVVTCGQSEGKLFIQQHILLDYDVEATALIIGAIVCVSRIVRVFSNIVFAKLYDKYQSKIGVALAILLGCAIGFILFGSFIGEVVVKIVVMAIGYMIILFVRDPYTLYVQDVVFSRTPKEQHQTLLTVLSFGIKVATAGIGLVFSAILLEYPMITIISIMFVMMLLEVLISLKLYREVAGSNIKKA